MNTYTIETETGQEQEATNLLLPVFEALTARIGMTGWQRQLTAGAVCQFMNSKV